jgi:hypothetical protein
MQTWLLCRGHFLQFARCLYSGFNALQSQQANTKRRSVINRCSLREDIHLPGTRNGKRLFAARLTSWLVYVWVTSSEYLNLPSYFVVLNTALLLQERKTLHCQVRATSRGIAVATSCSDVTHLPKLIHISLCFMELQYYCCDAWKRWTFVIVHKLTL